MAELPWAASTGRTASVIDREDARGIVPEYRGVSIRRGADSKRELSADDIDAAAQELLDPLRAKDERKEAELDRLARAKWLVPLQVGSVDECLLEVYETAIAASARVAQLIVDAARAKPELVLCLATGGTPTQVYRFLAKAAVADRELLSRIRVVKLDEWVGLPMDHSSTCEAYLQDAILPHLGLQEGDGRYLSFDSMAPDAGAECLRVKAALEAWGGVDVALLGLGLNCHLGLNEPCADVSAIAGVHVAELAESTQGHPMLSNYGVECTRGVTLGLDALMSANETLLLVTGAHKAAPLQAMLSGPPSSRRPASLLRRHAGARIVCDAACGASQPMAAASLPSDEVKAEIAAIEAARLELAELDAQIAAAKLGAEA